MLKVSELVEKYGDYEVDEEKLKEFLTPPRPKTVYDLKKVIDIGFLTITVAFVTVFGEMA